MSFTDLGLASGETLVIDHNDTGKGCVLRLWIMTAGGAWRTSVMDKRSAGSSDDLYVTPGVKMITVTAQRSGKITVMSSGRFA